jgi:capsular polysaccharide transport system permease protein
MKPSKNFCTYVLVPLLLVMVYQLFLAARVYESESRFVIRQIGQDAGMGNLGLPLLGSSGTSHQEDAVLLREYLISPNLLDNMDSQFDLASHYRKFGMDLLRHFPKNPSKEELLKAYRKMVSVQVLPEGGVVLLTVQAYDPETAQKLAGLITKEGEKFINRISEELANEQIDFVRKEVERAEVQLREVRQKLATFKNENAILDPEKQSETAIGLIAHLQGKLVEAKAEKIRLLSLLQENHPDVVANQQQIQALTQQIEEEKSLLTGSQDNTLNKVLHEYFELQLDSEFALEAYKAAFTSLETARLEASRNLKHFVTLSSTGLPEDPSHPRILYSLVSSLLVILLLYGIFHLIRATVLDHKL